MKKMELTFTTLRSLVAANPMAEIFYQYLEQTFG
jgi:hypothetical protein